MRVSPTLSLSALQLWDLSSQNKARGPRASFGCLSAREASGQRRGLWSVCVSEQGVTAAASGQDHAVALVCHIQNNEKVSQTLWETMCKHLFWHLGAFLCVCFLFFIIASASCFSYVCMKVSIVAVERGHCKTPGNTLRHKTVTFHPWYHRKLNRIVCTHTLPHIPRGMLLTCDDGLCFSGSWICGEWPPF